MSCSKCFDNYEEYLVEYLKSFPKLAVLLDYDGTLTPLVDRPELAKIPLETKEVLQRLATMPEIYLAVISGRKASDVKDLVGIDSITYAGNHGLEVIYPDGSTYEHKLPQDYQDQVKTVVANLEKEVVRDGAWIENKGASLTFHFREVPEAKRGEMEYIAESIIAKANFKVGKAHMAIEAKPKVDWNKGTVALMLLGRKYGCSWDEKAKVIFIGDDTTDEDAMCALKGKAATFRIANNCNIDTYADQIISSIEHAFQILRIINRLYRYRM